MSENVGTIEYTVTADTAALMTAGRSVDSINKGMQTGFDKTDASVSSLTGSFGRLSAVATSLMAVLSSNEILKYSDAWTNLNNKLVNSVSVNEQLVDVTTRVFNISQDTRTSIDATATLYGRLERSTRKYNLSAEQLISLTTTINKGLVVSGATTEEAASTMTQLSQALASGTLRGEEFNSLTENGSRLAIALADSLGVDIGQLRSMSAAGELTTKVVVDGLLKQGVAIGDEFSKTIRTIGQSYTVATNNITKFVGESSTVQSTVAGIGSAVVAVSENLDALTNVFIALTAVMGSRFAGALVASTTEMAKNAIASAAQAKSATVAAKAAELEAGAKLRSAQADKSAAMSALNLAQAQLNVVKQTNAEADADVRLAQAQAESIRTNLALIESEKVLETQRLQAQITEKGRIATATRMAELQQSSAVLTTKLAAQEAAAESAKAAAITAAEKNVSAARLAAADATNTATMANGRYIASQEAVVVASRASSIAINVFKGAMSLLGGPAGVVMLAATALYMWYQNAQQAKQEALAFADSVDTLTQSYTNLNHAQLEGTQAKLEESVIAQRDAISELQAEVDKTIAVMAEYKAQMDGIGQDSPAYAAAQDRYAQAVRDNKTAVADLDAAQGKLAGTSELLDKVNARLSGGFDVLSGKVKQLQADIAALSQTPVESRSADGDKLLKQLKDENALLQITDKRQRSIAAARQKAIESGVEAGSKQLQQIEAEAAAHYDLQQAEKDSAAASKAGGKAAKEAQNEKLKAAKEAQKELERQAKSGVSLVPDAAENSAYQKDVADLNAALSQKMISQEQYDAKSESLAATHQQNLAKISAQQAVTPQQSAAGDVDPVQALANENAQKLALIKAYEAQKVISTTTADQLIAAEQTKYDQQRLAALETQYRAQSALNDFTMSMIDTVGQRFGNMIVGMVTGTQSVSDAVRNLAATILDQAVGALVQMGVQALKNMLISQTATSASVAQAAVTGPAIAAAYAPAAAMTSLASFGANAAAAQAGIATTMATTQALALAGGRRYGGGVSAGNAYRINESGQSEVFQTSGGAQAFIPNKSGKVIPADEALGSGSDSPVNVVINNMASGTQVENQGYNPDTRTITLAVKEVARQMRNASGDVGRAMKDSWNVTSKSQ